MRIQRRYSLRVTDRRDDLAGRSVLVAHPSAELYGSDRVLIESVAGMVGGGARVTVALPQDGPLRSAVEEVGAAVEICPMPVLRKAAMRPAGFVRLAVTALGGLRPAWRVLRRSGADAVYVNTLTIPLWQVLARLAGVRIVVHVHEAEGSAPAPVRFLLAQPVSLAHTVIVNSRFSASVLHDIVPWTRRRTVVVYNGVRGPDETPVPPRETLADPVSVLFLGRLSARKGPQIALEAVRVLRMKGHDIRLGLLGAVFAGNEAFGQDLQAAAADPVLRGHVEFHGFVPDIWPVVAAADIVVIPSVVDEPFGNTAVEAVLGARPVVVSDTSGLREAAAGYASAMYVAPGDAGSVVGAIETIVAEWPRFRMGAVADSVKAAERHSVLSYRTEIAAIMRTAVERPTARESVEHV